MQHAAGLQAVVLLVVGCSCSDPPVLLLVPMVVLEMRRQPHQRGHPTQRRSCTTFWAAAQTRPSAASGERWAHVALLSSPAGADAACSLCACHAGVLMPAKRAALLNPGSLRLLCTRPNTSPHAGPHTNPFHSCHHPTAPAQRSPVPTPCMPHNNSMHGPVLTPPIRPSCRASCTL